MPATSAGVVAQLRMAGRFERGDDFQLRIGVAQRDEPLPHAAGGAVDGNRECGFMIVSCPVSIVARWLQPHGQARLTPSNCRAGWL